jgi:uncharacterized hydrophobic protein (TIGR00271 family)
MLPIFADFQFNLSYLNDVKRRVGLRHKIEEEIKFSPSYFVLLFGATVVVTLGLLINSSAVVIGAMIMAPLYWPMLGVALGIALGDRKILQQALKLLLASIIMSLAVSWTTSYLTPLNEMTREIAIRISPTILDLLIALTCSVIGVLAVYDPNISASVVGVVLSLALLPPLATSGIGLSFKNDHIFRGGLQFFVANMIAVIFVGVLTLYFLKIRPNGKEESHRFALGLGSSIFILILLAIPLTIYLNQAIVKNQIKANLKGELEAQLKIIEPDTRVGQIEIDFLSDLNSVVSIEALVYLPEGVYLTQAQQNKIVKELNTHVAGYVDLELSLVNTLFLRQDTTDSLLREIEDQTQTLAEKKLAELIPGSSLLKIQVEDRLDQEGHYFLELIVLMPENRDSFSLELEQFKSELQEEIDQWSLNIGFKLLSTESESF